MMNNRENRVNAFVTTLFLMLFFLFVSSHAGAAVKQSGNSARPELITQFHACPLSADLVSVIKLPTFSQSFLTSHDKLSFRSYDPPLKVSCDDKASNLILINIQKEEFITGSNICYHFFYRFYYRDKIDYPGLS
ncbi:MAG: hypothetical protein HXX13_05825 [Bacteroidetes bacterium]|nr:hypothetical protein [Bacteroidota bacterium]